MIPGIPEDEGGETPAATVECPTGADLVRWISLLIEGMGGIVRIDPEGENLCRRAPEQGSHICHVIEAQGLPNLVHELVHALFLGHLADDHGFDYGLIPLDPSEPDHRRHLWEELACCAISVAYCEVFEPDPATFRRAWFVEQVEIQGVFHGLEDDLPGFRAHIDRLLAAPSLSAELASVLDEGYRKVETALASVGAGPEIARPRERLDVQALWASYRQTW